ncbi:MAG: BglG family transcription antiterminator [Selenomonadaceae bacterium]|nr:BglG family transcription antiterminator [Selenomonadaceae bacterium]
MENDGTITIGEIAEKLNVSAKTISRQLPKVEELFNNYNLKLDKRTGAGLKVLGSAVKKFAILELGKSSIYKREYSPKERLSVITSTLLLSREPIKLFSLSSSLQVTDSTISSDLDKLEPWFQERGLRLLRKPGLGISLLGSERDFRRAIVKYIYEHIGESELLNLAQYNLNVKTDERMVQTSNFLLNLIDENVWNKLDKEIHTLESELGYQFSDNAFIGLVVHVSLTIERIKNNETIKVDDEIIKSIQNKREYTAVSKLTNKLEQLFDIKIPENEMAYITMHILGARNRYSSDSLGSLSMMDDFRLVQIARSIMKAAAKETGRAINKNQNLLAGLVNHLAPSISRLKMNMDIRNPLLSEMKQHYPELMELTTKCVGELEAYVGQTLPESEIAYIAMHLGAAIADSEPFLNSVHRVVVACPTGMGTSRLLASRLRKKFPNLKIVDQIPILSINENYIASMDFEFVISTVPIMNAHCKVVVVGAALSREDCAKIEAELAIQNEKFLSSAVEIEPKLSFLEALSKMNEYSQAILDLLSNCFFSYADVNDITAACEAAGQLVSSSPINAKNIADALIRREGKGSTLFSGHHMILLHCKTDYVNALTIGIIRLGKGFDYSGEVVKTAIVLIAPNDSSQCAIDTIGHAAAVLIDRWSFIEILHEGNRQEIVDELTKIFADFYKEKFNELMR